MLKKKDAYATTSKLCRVLSARERGERFPVIELNFLADKTVSTGHKVYVNLDCAKRLLSNLQNNIDVIESTYDAANYYERRNYETANGTRRDSEHN